MPTIAPPDLNLDALDAAVDALLQPAPAGEPKPERVEPGEIDVGGPGPLVEAIDKVIGGAYPAPRQLDRRRELVAALVQSITDLPVYGVEIPNARVPLGDAIYLGNVTVGVDGYGHASEIDFDEAYPVWDAPA